MNMDSMQRQIRLLEQAMSKASARVGEVREENKRLKQQVEQLQHELADRSRRLAVLEQAEEKFLGVQSQTAFLKDERQRLKTEVEQLLRKVASLKAAALQSE